MKDIVSIIQAAHAQDHAICIFCGADVNDDDPKEGTRFIQRNYKHIEDAMVRAGFDAIETLKSMED